MHKIFKNLQMSSTNSASGLGQEFPTKFAVYSSRLQGYSSPWTEEELMPKLQMVHTKTAESCTVLTWLFIPYCTWNKLPQNSQEFSFTNFMLHAKNDTHSNIKEITILQTETSPASETSLLKGLLCLGITTYCCYPTTFQTDN